MPLLAGADEPGGEGWIMQPRLGGSREDVHLARVRVAHVDHERAICAAWPRVLSGVAVAAERAARPVPG